MAGAAALVLEKYPHYTPAEVKQHLINEATNDAINMDVLKLMRFAGDKGTNKLLYVGNGKQYNIYTALPGTYVFKFSVVNCNATSSRLCMY